MLLTLTKSQHQRHRKTRVAIVCIGILLFYSITFLMMQKKGTITAGLEPSTTVRYVYFSPDADWNRVFLVAFRPPIFLTGGVVHPNLDDPGVLEAVADDDILCYIDVSRLPNDLP